MDLIRTITLKDNIHLTPELKAIVDDLCQDADIVLPDITAPYDMAIAYTEGEVTLNLRGDKTPDAIELAIGLRSLRGVLRDYTQITDNFQAAVASGDLQRFEAIDLGKRALHDEAADMIIDMLSPRCRIGHGTARKLFTLICTLQPSGKTLS